MTIVFFPRFITIDSREGFHPLISVLMEYIYKGKLGGDQETTTEHRVDLLTNSHTAKQQIHGL